MENLEDIDLKRCSGCLLPIKSAPKLCTHCRCHYYHDKSCQKIHYFDGNHRSDCKWQREISRDVSSVGVIYFYDTDNSATPLGAAVNNLLTGGPILHVTPIQPTSASRKQLSLLSSPDSGYVLLGPLHHIINHSWNELIQFVKKGTHSKIDKALDTAIQNTSDLDKILSLILELLDSGRNFNVPKGLSIDELRVVVARRFRFLCYSFSDMGSNVSPVDEGKASEYRIKAIKCAKLCLESTLKLSDCALAAQISNDVYVEWVQTCEDMQDMEGAREAAKHSFSHSFGGLWSSEWQRPGQSYKLFVSRKENRLSSNAIWPSSSFDFTEILENNWRMIYGEATSILKGNKTHAVGWHGDTEDHKIVEGNWEEVVLFGRNSEPHLAPQTVSLLQQHCTDAVEMAEVGGGEIIFSFLGPDTHIKAHCAATDHRLTAHLGLKIPCPEEEGKCEIRVGETWFHWQDGKVLVFDDSYEHEIRNATRHLRVILLLRFPHPDIRSMAELRLITTLAKENRERQYNNRWNFVLVNDDY